MIRIGLYTLILLWNMAGINAEHVSMEFRWGAAAWSLFFLSLMGDTAGVVWRTTMLILQGLFFGGLLLQSEFIQEEVRLAVVIGLVHSGFSFMLAWKPKNNFR